MAIQDGTLNGGSAQTDGKPTGNAYLDSLIWGAKWEFTIGEPTLSYAFDSGIEGIAFLESEKNAFRQIVANYEAVCKVDFEEVSDLQSPDILWIKDDTIIYGGFLLPNTLASHKVPDETGSEPLWGAFNTVPDGWLNVPTQGSYFYNIVLHEIGHGMGLAHPHDGGSQFDGTMFPGVTYGDPGDTGTNELNQGIWSVMSYNDGWNQAPGVNDLGYGASYGWSGTLMAFDIAALQYLYGANTTYNTGDNTYSLVSKNGNGTFWSCLWDAGGTDTISNAGSNTSSTINLNDATLVVGDANAGGFVSRVDGIKGGFTIANGAVIENAIGGNAKDVLSGNEFANKLEGRDGNDELYGNDGHDALLGGYGNDTLRGEVGTDVLSGEANDDKLYGGTGNDELNGGDGNDVLSGEEDSDTLFGGDGYDTLYGGAGSDVLHGQANLDVLHGEAADDELNGGDGDDSLLGEAANDELNGDGGDDVLEGGEGDDVLNGGAGKFDAASYSDAANAITVNFSGADGQYDFGKGIDTFISIEGIIGTEFADKLSGTNGVHLDGDSGNDFIEGSSAADKLSGGIGTGDTVSYANAAGAISVNFFQGVAKEAGGNDDIVSGFEILIGSKFADKIIADGGVNTLEGGEGDDYIFGGSGADYMDGGDGADTLSYSDSSSTDTSGVTVDLLLSTASGTGQAKGDVILNFENVIGGSGNDRLTGNTIGNMFQGNGGNDILFGGGGLDIYIFGYNGDIDTVEDFSLIDGDKISFNTFSFVQSLADLFSRALIREDDGDTIIDFRFGDALILKGVAVGDLDDTNFAFAAANEISGTSGADTINGAQTVAGQPFASAGEDLIHGLEGDDDINGLAGNDIVDGGAGNDKMVGGSGNDTISYETALGAVSVTLVPTAQQDTKGAGKDTISEFENITGSAFDDTLTGSGQDNILIGLGGDDLLIGGLGADAFDGGDGSDTVSYAGSSTGVTVVLDGVTAGKGSNAAGDEFYNIENIIGTSFTDSLTGNTATNTLDGGDSNDTLDGGDGNDTLIGGAGQDNLTGGAGSDKFFIGNNLGFDTINDFSAAEVDVINVVGFTYLQSVADLLALGLLYQSTGSVTLNAGNARLSLVGVTLHDILDDKYFAFSQVNTIVGTSGNDVIASNETVPPFATSDSDDIQGLAGDDKIEGGSGLDTIDGGAGNDKMAGGTNTDTVAYTSATSAVFVTLASTGVQDTKGAGKDTVSEFENILGSAFDDVLTGDALKNGLMGGDGNDTLVGGAGDDVLAGGANGIVGDTASYAATKVSVSASLADGTAYFLNGKFSDNDKLFQIENLIGGTGKDQLSGDINANTLDGAAGDDQLFGDSGNDVLIGGAGNDILDGGDGIDTVSFAGTTSAIIFNLATQSGIVVKTGAGNDKISGFENIIGGKGADKITGNAGKNTIDGGDGNDIIEGGAEADRLFGRLGIDTLSYALSMIAVAIFLFEQGTTDAFGNVLTEGDAQTGGDAEGDLIWGFENLTGSGLADTLEGDKVANVIVAGAGDDKVSGLGGKDTLDGGAGIDTLNFSYLGSAQHVTATLGTLNTKTGAVAKTSTSGVVGDIDGIANFENLIGGAGNDKLTGNAGDNMLEGGGGNDQLYGMAGTDTLDGGEGDDLLEGGAGGDPLDGGADSDTVSYKSSSLAVTVDLQADTAAGGDATGDKLDNIENLTGSAKHDVLTGDGGDNIIEGGLGDDLLDGGAGTFDTLSYTGATAAVIVDLGKQGSLQSTGGGGKDTASNFENLTGGKGADKLTGDGDANTIIGGAGNDIINGGSGADQLQGGLGADTLTGGADADTFHIKWGEGADKVTDFLSGTDEIVLDLAATLAPALSIISGNAPSNAGLSPALLYDTDDGRLFYDSGPGAAVHIATLTNKAAIDINDFSFV